MSSTSATSHVRVASAASHSPAPLRLSGLERCPLARHGDRPQRWTVTVMSVLGAKIILKARPTDRVSRLKERIAYATSISSTAQALVFRNHELCDQDDRNLQELGVVNHSVINLLVRAQAGPIDYMPAIYSVDDEMAINFQPLEHSDQRKMAPLVYSHDYHHQNNNAIESPLALRRQPCVELSLYQEVFTSQHTDHLRMKETMDRVRADLQALRQCRVQEQKQKLSTPTTYSDTFDQIYTTGTDAMDIMFDDDDDDDDRVDPATLVRPSTPEPVLRQDDDIPACIPPSCSKSSMKRQHRINRCDECDIKITAVQYSMTCRCGNSFCSSHRISHDCQYRYR